MRNTDVSTEQQNINLRTIMACAVMLLFRVTLDFLYINYVVRFYASDYFSLNANSMPRLLESYAIALILSAWLAFSVYHRRRPSSIALVLYLVVVILPLTSLYGLADAPPAFIYAATGSFAVLLVVTSSLPSVRFPRPDCNLLAIGILLLAGISAYVYGMLLLSGGFRRLSFDLLSVYEVRAEFTKTMAPFMGYFVPWQATVINIVLLCYGLYKKRRWLIALACVAQLLIFGMTGHKSFLLAPMLAGGVYFIWRTKNVLSYIFGGATLLALAAYLLFLISGNLLAPAILVHRLFFVPAGLHLIYYDFFSQPEHPLVMLSNSILAPFVPYPYEVPIMWVISRAYWGRDFSPNVGYLGDAYAHFGFMGMFLFSIVLGVFLRVLDGAGSRLPSHLVAAIVAVPAMALTNAGLFTSLLTHGLIPTLVVIWLLRAAEARRNESARLTVRELVQVKSKTFL